RFAGHRSTADMLFPGFVALVLGSVGAVSGWRAGGRLRAATAVYGGLAVLGAWLSFGPAAGLYSALYSTVPGFTFMRAPSRFGLVSAFALSVLAGIALARRFATAKRSLVAAVGVLGGAIAELYAPLRF